MLKVYDCIATSGNRKKKQQQKPNAMGIKLKTHANHHTNRSKVEVKHFSRRLLQFQLQFHFHFHFNAVYGFSDFDRNANCGSAVDCDADAARNQRKCLLLFLQFVAKLHVVTTAGKNHNNCKSRSQKQRKTGAATQFRNAMLFTLLLILLANISFIFFRCLFACHCPSLNLISLAYYVYVVLFFFYLPPLPCLCLLQFFNICAFYNFIMAF